MWKSIKKFFGVKEKLPLNLDVFHHDLAHKTRWMPIKHGGSQFKNVKLVKKSSDVLRYESTTSRIVINVLIIGIPLVFFMLSVVGVSLEQLDKFTVFPGLLLPLFLLVLGGFGLYNALMPNIFDKRLGLFYQSYRKPRLHTKASEHKNWIALDTIAALQIVEERVRTKNSSYKSYELNLVLEDGERFNVIDHGNYERIKDDAKTIADFLGIPYWDAIAPYAYQPETPKHRTSQFSNEDLDAPYDSTKQRKL